MGEKLERFALTILAVLSALWLWERYVKHWLGLNPGGGEGPKPEEGGLKQMSSKTYQALVGMAASKLAQFPITQVNMTFTANTANLMTDVYTMPVPRGTVLHFRPTDFLAALFQSAAATPILATSLWELVARDPTGRQSEVLTGGTYAQLASFTDSTLKKFLGIARSYGPEWVIAIRVRATTVMTTADSSFLLTAMQEYAAL